MSSKTSKSQLTLEQRYALINDSDLILLKLLVTKMSVMIILLY